MNGADVNSHVVEYYLYLNIHPSCTEKLQFLEDVKCQMLNLIERFLKPYIWQKDKFELLIHRDDELPYLYGIVDCGWNMEDEWFIVFLMMEISREYRDCIIRVVDVDGEFLLIEAAESLEKWMSPKRCSGRVYIMDNSVRVISPRSISGAELEPTEAVQMIRKNPAIAESKVHLTNITRSRIENYPEAIDKSKHHARVYIPAQLAALLDSRPQLIASAINALWFNDIIDKKEALKNVKYCKRENCVLHLATFTKYLFAMLTSNECIAPCIDNDWNMTDEFKNIEKEYKLGYKISMGFEFLVLSQKERIMSNNKNRQLFKLYIKSLEEKGYFKDTTVKEYKRKFHEAEIAFLRECKPSVEADDNDNILAVIKNLKCNVEEYKKREETLPPSDAEDWLKITETELINMLEKQAGIKTTKNSQDLLSGLNNFLECHLSDSDYDEGDDDDDSSANEDDNDDNNSEQYETEEGIVNFDVDGFCNFLKKNLGDMRIDELESKNSLKQYMNMMDEELANSTLASSFITYGESNKKSAKSVSFAETETKVPRVNVEENALQNLVQSCEEEAGGPGPTRNLLNAIGLRLQKPS